MALNTYAANVTGTGPTMAAPTTTETIDTSSGNTLLLVTVGATATTVTLVVPGNDEYGLARPDVTSASLSNTTRAFLIPRSAADSSTGMVTVTFSQVTAVTASIVRM